MDSFHDSHEAAHATVREGTLLADGSMMLPSASSAPASLQSCKLGFTPLTKVVFENVHLERRNNAPRASAQAPLHGALKTQMESEALNDGFTVDRIATPFSSRDTYNTAKLASRQQHQPQKKTIGSSPSLFSSAPSSPETVATTTTTTTAAAAPSPARGSSSTTAAATAQDVASAILAEHDIFTYDGVWVLSNYRTFLFPQSGWSGLVAWRPR